jgi:1-acyl-sn-glycerol-3-phosphate acyltransferase
MDSQADRAASAGAGAPTSPRPLGERLVAPLRIAWRGGWIVFYTLAAWALLLVSQLLGKLLGHDRRQRLRNWVFRTWARRVTATLGMRIAVRGEAPRPPFFLVSNHLGYLDIMLLATAVDAVFVSKAEVRHWPLFGRICYDAETIFVDRGSRRDVLRVHREMRRVFDLGYGVIVFPEGTTTAGDSLLPFKPPLLEFPAGEGLPVHAAAITYATPPDQPPASQAVCWFGDAPFGAHFLGLLRMRGLAASIEFAEEAVLETDRKELAARLHREISRRFTPVNGHPPRPIAIPVGGEEPAAAEPRARAAIPRADAADPLLDA